MLGWGSTQQGGSPSNVLRVASVLETSLSRCNTSYNGIITNNMLCAGGRAAGCSSADAVLISMAAARACPACVRANEAPTHTAL